MVDWEEISKTENEDKLREVKIWLFQENVRLQNELRVEQANSSGTEETEG